jgi:hypothetical protein
MSMMMKLCVIGSVVSGKHTECSLLEVLDRVTTFRYAMMLIWKVTWKNEFLSNDSIDAR